MWEGSKFWKQFFEASANVSLSGYEEADLTASITHDEDDTDDIEATSTTTPRRQRPPTDAQATTPGPASFAQYPSPYEALKRDIRGVGVEDSPDATSTPMVASPETPAKSGVTGATLPDMSMTPESSPFAMPSSAVAPSTLQRSTASGSNLNNDPLLHRVLDKTYRIAATPHTQRKQKAAAGAATPGTATRSRPAFNARHAAFDSSPMSSPDVPAPQLRAELFSSPMKTGPRTPGVSVQTPGLKKKFADRDAAKANAASAAPPSASAITLTPSGDRTLTLTSHQRRAWDSDDSDEDFGDGFSPPKTMQFHIPQSRLLQTPGSLFLFPCSFGILLSLKRMLT